MIYKDTAAGQDCNAGPAFRPSNCLNCGEQWGDHLGWRCPGTVGFDFRRFKDLPPRHRYITQAMYDSIGGETNIPLETPTATTTESSPVDLSDWKKWRDVNRLPTDCACGIPRNVCSYHR